MRVLIIDDNKADVYIIQGILDSLPHLSIQSVVINSGTDAIDYLLKRSPYKNVPDPDLIILDLNLPGHSGLDILSIMKKNDMLIPVVVYTTSDREQDVKKAYGLRANSYIVKPSDYKEIERVLKLVGEFWLNCVKLP